MPGKEHRPRPKHTPQRTCVVCRNKFDKRALVRLVRTENGVFVDPSGKQHGRGAYLCSLPTCWDRAVETDVLARALRTSLTDADRVRIKAARPNNYHEN